MKHLSSTFIIALILTVEATAFTGCTSATGDNTGSTTTSTTVAATGISFDASTKTLSKGNSFTLTATIVPANTTDSVTWSSSNTSYVTVKGSGKTATITAAKAALNADTTVTVSAKIRSYTATCSVTVTGLKTSATVSDASANDSVKLLFQYLTDYYGKQIIAGQMENAWNDNCNMLNRVYTETGKYPALMGFDFMNYTGINSYTASNCQTERALKFWNGQNYSGTTIASGKHGIIQFMWHWRDPDATSSTDGNFYTKAGNSTQYTTYQIPYDCSTDTWNTSSTSYTHLVNNLDTIATQLATLQTAGVPVLWRPLHEAAGNIGAYTDGEAWFWWGNSGDTNAEKAESYIALWKFMYTYFTSTKGLHNLIWVWNAQNKNYYPGDAYVDIIGDDIYSNDHTSLSSAYTQFTTMSDNSSVTSKIVALTECGRIPLPANCSTDSAWWRWFMVWNDGDWDNSSSSVTTNTSSSNFWSGTYFNDATVKSAVYTSDIVITLDELPDLTTYTAAN